MYNRKSLLALDPSLTRRQALARIGAALGAVTLAPQMYGCDDDGASTPPPTASPARTPTTAPTASVTPTTSPTPASPVRISNIANLGPLGAPDANGIRLPAGFSSRVVAVSRRAPVPTSSYRWHVLPDGGATFAAADGGWVYVSNSEFPVVGGAGALRFDAAGNLVSAYPILARTTSNCAGGPTPWGTWLSCEEYKEGRVWECDPFGVDKEGPNLGRARPALGAFEHEAVTVDPVRGHLYMTEDVPDGRLYRFTPERFLSPGHPDLSSGTLEVMQVHGDPTGPVSWHVVPVPVPDFLTTTYVETRHQVPQSTPFRGGEGIWYRDDIIYFSTKGDNRIWLLNVETQVLELLYDDDNYPEPILTGVDNIVVSDGGDVLVAEDGGDLQLVAITPSGLVLPVLQIVGQTQTEIAGPAFSPDGKRLYFSSQAGNNARFFEGITYEVTGPYYL